MLYRLFLCKVSEKVQSANNISCRAIFNFPTNFLTQRMWKSIKTPFTVTVKVVLNGVLMLFILYFKIFHTATSVHERLFFHARREIFTFSVLIVKLRTISSFPAFSRVISLSIIFSYQISRYNSALFFFLV